MAESKRIGVSRSPWYLATPGHYENVYYMYMQLAKSVGHANATCCNADLPSLQARSPRFYSAVAAAGVVAGYSLVSIAAGDLELHPPKYAWNHKGLFSALDHQR